MSLLADGAPGEFCSLEVGVEVANESWQVVGEKPAGKWP